MWFFIFDTRLFHGKVLPLCLVLFVTTSIYGEKDCGWVKSISGKAEYKTSQKRSFRKLKKESNIRHGYIIRVHQRSVVRIITTDGKKMSLSASLKGPKTYSIQLDRCWLTYQDTAGTGEGLVKSGLGNDTAATRRRFVTEQEIVAFLIPRDLPRARFKNNHIFFRWDVADSYRDRVKVFEIVIFEGEFKRTFDVSHNQKNELKTIIKGLKPGIVYDCKIFFKLDGVSSFRTSSFEILSANLARDLERDLSRIRLTETDLYIKEYMRSIIFHRYRLFYDSYLAAKNAIRMKKDFSLFR